MTAKTTNKTATEWCEFFGTKIHRATGWVGTTKLKPLDVTEPISDIEFVKRWLASVCEPPAFVLTRDGLDRLIKFYQLVKTAYYGEETAVSVAVKEYQVDPKDFNLCKHGTSLDYPCEECEAERG